METPFGRNVIEGPHRAPCGLHCLPGLPGYTGECEGFHIPGECPRCNPLPEETMKTYQATYTTDYGPPQSTPQHRETVTANTHNEAQEQVRQQEQAAGRLVWFIETRFQG